MKESLMKCDRYGKYGKPVPNQLLMTEAQRKTAIEHSMDTDSLVVRYVRGEPHLVKDPKAPKSNQYRFAKGRPYGALVAIKLDGQIAVGWSKYNMVDEPLPFTNRDARDCAICRAVADTITIVSDNNMVSENGEIIPQKVVREIPDFINRVSKYLPDLEFANVSVVGKAAETEVVVVDEG